MSQPVGSGGKPVAIAVVAFICLAAVPIIVTPLLKAYKGDPKEQYELSPGFRKKGLSELDPALLAKARKLALGVGTAAGAFGSLVGVGGGVLIAPVILNACRSIPQRVISGTSLAAVAATGTTAGYVYWQNGHVDLKSAAMLAAGAVILAPLGARATHMVNCKVSPGRDGILGFKYGRYLHSSSSRSAAAGSSYASKGRGLLQPF
eukprot:jgi/Chrzof1/4447/Cz14g13150.t1